MGNIITIGFATEGRTDVRFLENIIRRTFEDVAFECESYTEIYSVEHIPTGKSKFEEEVLKAARKAKEEGIMVLCVHTDADDAVDKHAFTTRIDPAFKTVRNETSDICKNLVAVVPVQMTEAWMLADPDLLKDEIGTEKSLQELKLNRAPETIADPKQIIKDAIIIAIKDQTQRQRKRSVDISDLYLPTGQRIKMQRLEKLPSFLKFKEDVRNAYRYLNYLH